MVSSAPSNGSLSLCIRSQFACHGDVFNISCSSPWDDDEQDGGSVIVLTSARYGLGSSAIIARRCRVPFSRLCNVDVHHAVSRACAGHRKCSVPLSGGYFGRPCGGADGEFLSVGYRCIPRAYSLRVLLKLIEKESFYSLFSTKFNNQVLWIIIENIYHDMQSYFLAG